jgi:hypothetical protein
MRDDRLDELALSLSLLPDEKLHRLVLVLWMRYPRAANQLRNSIDQLENILTAPCDEGGS